MILPQFRPYIEQGEIASLPSYHFYMRLGALNPEEPFSGVTIPVQITYSQKRFNEVIEEARVHILGPSEFEDFSNQQKQYMVVLLHYSFCAVILENSLPQFLGM
jgi:hypothetical protein